LTKNDVMKLARRNWPEIMKAVRKDRGKYLISNWGRVKLPMNDALYPEKKRRLVCIF